MRLAQGQVRISWQIVPTFVGEMLKAKETKVGDRVVYADGLGAYATARLYPADRLTIIP
jgi:NADPH:quinone reductase-like Zn-dependent oxidoreductase